MTSPEPSPEALRSYLNQARANDRTLHPRPGPLKTAADVVGNFQYASPGGNYPSPEQVSGWVTQPETFTADVHERECQSGSIISEDLAGEYVSHPCPRCAAERAQARLRAQLTDAGVDGRYLDTGWADLDVVAPLDRVQAACERITEVIDAGASLLLWSLETGSGKTQAAMLAATAAIQAGRSAAVVNLARLAVEVRDGYGDKTGTALKEGAVLRRLATPQLLVLDDLGAGETDSAAIERRLLFLALDERQTRLLPTVITTNLTPHVLTQVFGSRIIARLQPLTVIHVDHQRNFRVNPAARPLW